MGNKVFICGGTSYNAVITLPKFFRPQPQTIHSCEYYESIGNTGAGKALALSKLDFETTLHTLLGDDDHATKIRRYFNQPNLKVMAEVDSKGTERHLNILNSKGERISIFTNPSSEILPIHFEKYKGTIADSDVVVINISNYCRGFLPICKDLKKEVWTDLHDYNGSNPYHQDFIDAADYIFLSSVNLKDYRSFMEQMIDMGKKLVVCTHAGNGATAYTYKKEWFYEPAISEFKLVNSNGAGDNFFAGFLFGFSQGKSIQMCMKFGTVAGAMCISTNDLVSGNLNHRTLQRVCQEYYDV